MRQSTGLPPSPRILACSASETGAGAMPYWPSEVVLHFLGDDLVALAHQDVGNGLVADHLGQRRDQRGIAQILADLGDLLERCVELIHGLHIGQVRDHVGEHAAGNLVDERLRVGRHGLGADAAGIDVLLLDGLEVIVDLVDDVPSFRPVSMPYWPRA